MDSVDLRSAKGGRDPGQAVPGTGVACGSAALELGVHMHTPGRRLGGDWTVVGGSGGLGGLG